MLNYLIRRLYLLIPVVLGVSTLVFLIIHLIPGDPVVLMLGDLAIKADIESLRGKLGLDKPVYIQYLDFLLNLFRGDLGRSIHTDKPVVQAIGERFPATFELAMGGVIISLLISLPLGIVSALKKDTIIDNCSRFFAFLGISVPNFWLGPMLIILFSIKIGILPVSGRGGIENLILPSITLGMGMAATVTRMVRASLLEVIKENYITTARAKGLSESSVVIKHALKNALMPVVTIVGLQLGALLSGAIITETIFSWPGIGSLTIEAINRRDYPMVQGCIFVIAMCYVIVNLATDLIYGFLDPRIRYE
ncbi:MAG: glutathione ABC transporter permease GsiC [Candidatus Schekmanbacteria bacterium RIFCSPHIGHO2_02_FULL_38_11]|uniref:Glutathione ABC transporter permease GsiC n=1 Tax=Candidatus Schekmanbacteria bacterium RIFCSPLOWO2_12_FULL_38_15 TaxID=1817883 RepID=A0A1F7SC67_9BACT|nr:MAG: glutathione ABC transporter permease GsiC [Candidatus Schekmanbacteria bacterium RIFCSPHIGHO2_02_FULL_38_11]OGL49316.1 MAG: glutathione ABC transporter permease GsiC [Candidatus Schekmanbacteria bacterium RIFCSPLOWO2_02_FULL_38_14]OGL51376.1 MAG: glutathione ABC transporter permease GsiC [Candidatus Schekmanbacteria bacterium RIFCSPLOWO2_12_FULL_38_15]